MPAWTRFDPLPVLAGTKRDEDDVEEEANDDWHEARTRRLFNPMDSDEIDSDEIDSDEMDSDEMGSDEMGSDESEEKD